MDPKFQIETMHNKTSFNKMITVHYMRHQKTPITWLYALAIVIAGMFWMATARGNLFSTRALLSGAASLVLLLVLVAPLDRIAAKLVVKRMTKKSIKATNEIDEPIRYRFYEDEMDAADSTERNAQPYSEAKDLVETPEFFMIFMKSAQCYLMRKTDFTMGKTEDFPAFVAQKTGLTWAPYHI